MAKGKGKELMDKAKKGLKTAGDKIAKTSKKAFDLASLEAKKLKLEQDNKKRFQKLGTLAYNKGGMTGQMEQVGEKIKENKKQIKKLNAQLKQAQGKDKKK